MKEDKSKIIETKELPIIGFCSICEKPIYIGDEYEEIFYYGNSDKKRINKKDIVRGLAHKDCALEKQDEINKLVNKDNKHNQIVLTFSIVSGFIVALTLMLILLFLTKLIVVLSIIIPLSVGYLITSQLYVTFTDNKVGNFYKLIFLKLSQFPLMVNDTNIGLPLKIILWVLGTPFCYLLLALFFVLSMPISMFVFLFLLLYRKK